MSNIVDFHKLLVSCRSISGNEEPALKVVADFLYSKNIDYEIVDRNIIAHIYFGPGRSMLFNSHLDTVPPCEGWESDPWNPLENNGRITGLGANDAKGCVSSMLFAADRLVKDPPSSGSLTIALTCDEEISTGKGLETVIKQLPEPAGGIVGEPTALDVCIAQKGLIVLTWEAIGKSCHAANAYRIEHENAIINAVKDICKINSHVFQRVHPLLGPVTCNVTMVNGGKAHNIIPDSCIFKTDIRTTPVYMHDDIVNILKELVDSNIIKSSTRLVPYQSPENSLVAECALATGISNIAKGSDTFSDLAFFGDIDAVKAGPGRTEVSHTANEYIEIAQLEKGIIFYEQAARNFFGAPLKGNTHGKDLG